MRLLFLFCYVLSGGALFAQQQYIVTKLFDMAATADKIVHGTIVREEGPFIYIHASPGKGATVKVEKYISRPGAQRWDIYRPGQKVVLFLRKSQHAYRIMSEGGEGELPIINDSVILDLKCFTPATNQLLAGRGGVTEAYRNQHSFQVGNKKIFAAKCSLPYFLRSVMDFRDCYQIILKKEHTEASKTCFNFFDRYPRSKSDAMKRKSALMRLMYADMESAQIINCK